MDRPPEIGRGTDYAARPLPAGCHLDSFLIGRLICGSYSGYTYAATDEDKRRPLIIQEYFPEEVSVRDLDRISVLLRDETVSNEFEFGLTRFHRLIRALTRFNGKGRVVAAFEQNDTAYYVSDFDFRCTLNDVLGSRKKVPGANIESWLKACLRFLVTPHQANLLHLGIQADSILLDGEGDAILVGFNSVGPSFHIEPHKPEYLYLPIERIRSEAEMIPASDLYSLGAVLLHCMTGEPPIHAARRTGAVSTGRPDPLEEQLRAVETEHAPNVLRALRWMLAPQPKDRPQSAIEALDALDSGATKPIPTVHTAAPKAAPRVASKTVPEPRSTKKSRRSGERTAAAPVVETAPVLLATTAAASPAPAIGGRADKEEPARPADDRSEHETPPELLVRDREEIAHHGPQDWFADGEPAARSSIFGAIVNHPVSWLGAIVVALAAAWIWLGTGEEPAVPERDASVPRINVVPEGGAEQPVASSQGPQPTVILESASQITARQDTQRFQELRQLDALERRLEPHFKEVEAHLANDRLASPENANALEAYRRILEIDPENTRAAQGIESIRETLIDRAESALAAGNLEAAEREVSLLQGIDSATDEVDRIRSEVAQVRLERELAAEAERRRAAEEAARRQAEQQRAQQMQQLLSRAVASFDSGRLVEPPLDNALYYYREILKIDPASERANAGIEQIANRFVGQARQALATSDYELADRNLTTAAAIDPANPEIPVVRDQIDTRQRLAEQEQRALAEAQRNQQEAQDAARSQAEMSLQSGIGAYYRGNYDEAYSFLLPLANSGNARAQFRLAVMLQNGRGVATNHAEARKWFLAALEPIRIAAEQGRAWAQADLGSYYEDGIILDTNYNEAAKWYLRSAEQGYAGAQTNLGVMYANGLGVEPDMDRAVEWFKRAAVQGDSIAKENLRILGYNPDDIVLGASR